MSGALPLTPEQQDDAYMHLLPAFDERLHPTYNPALPYHNWGHAEDVAAGSLALRDRLLAADVPGVPGYFATEIKGKGHDGGLFEYFHSPYLRQIYASAEQYSMALTANALKTLGVDDNTIAEITGDQYGTKAGIICKTIGSLCVCEADVANTSEDYDTVFMPKMPKIRRDFIMLNDKDPGEEKFADMSLQLLSTYYIVNLNPHNLSKITKYLRAEREQRQQNLARLAKERAAQSGIELLSYAKDMGLPVLRVLGYTKNQARSIIKMGNPRKNVA